MALTWTKIACQYAFAAGAAGAAAELNQSLVRLK
jgi:hypothetical protein